VFGLFRSKKHDDVAHTLYVGIVNQARVPAFYTEFEVPDTPDGRFDMILLHVFLMFHRLKDETGEAPEIAQAVFDLLFADMDQNLREMGIGDVGVSHRIKGMVKALNGRVTVYGESLEAGDNTGLEVALRRNLYRKTEPSGQSVGAIATYMRREIDALSAQQTSDIVKGRITFGAPGGEQA